MTEKAAPAGFLKSSGAQNKWTGDPFSQIFFLRVALCLDYDLKDYVFLECSNLLRPLMKMVLFSRTKLRLFPPSMSLCRNIT